MIPNPPRLPDADTDPETRDAAYKQFIEAFLASPEGAPNPVLREADCGTEQIQNDIWTLLDMAEEYLNAYPATLDSAQMESLLLDICPRVLLLPSSHSPRKLLLILEAFWHFLDRVYRQPHAPAVLERLSRIADTFEQRMVLPRSAEGLEARPATLSPLMDLTEPFDLHALDDKDEEDLEEEDLWPHYLEGLMHHFRASPEGQPLLGSGLDHERWLYAYLDYGQEYYGLPTELNRANTEWLLLEDLPRKITPHKDNRPEDIVPGLIAFWQYLGRAHDHPAAPEVLEYLHTRGLGKQFREAIFDPRRGGIAKQFLLAGEQAGFDMSDQQQMAEFQAFYNASLRGGDEPLPGPMPSLPPGMDGLFDEPPQRGGSTDPGKKRKRKAAKAARKANKPKKKKK